MVGFFIAAVVVLQAGATQYMQSVQSPSRMPSGVFTWKFFHAFGLLVSAGSIILFVAGFFFFPWWAPFLGLVGGMFLHTLLPRSLAQPGFVYLSTVIATPLVVLSVQVM